MKEHKDFFSIRSAYLIGIKGTAMEALAEIFKARHVAVEGSDVTDVFYTDALLEKMKIKVHQGFDAKNIPRNADIIIHSTAYNAENNAEVAEATKRKLAVMNYPQALGMLFNAMRGIAVCGTHGKTTTTGMLAEILRGAGLSPTALVGSKVQNWGGSSLHGTGPDFVLEADEYQDKLQYYRPKGVIVTNIDYDHPDFFKTKKQYVAVFKKFLDRIPKDGFLVFNAGDKEAAGIARKIKARCISFGEGKGDLAILRRVPINNGGQRIFFTSAEHDGKQFEVHISLSGLHNALDAMAALAAASQLGVDLKKSMRILKKFRSTKRRFQEMGSWKGGKLIDDYAHHPNEILATLAGAKEKFPSSSIVVGFHPHTFTRTKALFKEFSESFAMADKVYVLDIYSSAREAGKKIKVHSRDLADAIRRQGVAAVYVPTIQELAKTMKKEMNPNTVFISMGAGDIWKVHELIKGS